MRVIFFGTPNYAAETLTFLLQHGIDVVAVVTKPDKPQGRSREPVPTPVKQALLQSNPSIPLFQPVIVSEVGFAPTLEAFKADLFIVVAYGEILKQHLLDMPRLACINVHFSLLPKYRGAAPIQQAILHGETETGVTIMHMVKKLDAGDIIEMTHVPIDENITSGELGNKLCISGCHALLKVINEYASGNIPAHYAQDEQLVTFAKKIELEDCEIDWKKSNLEIHNLVRGVNPEPGAWCKVHVKDEMKRLKIKNTRLINDKQAAPGTLINYGKEGLIVGCGEGALEILELQLEGKKPMQGIEFTRGIQITF